MTNTFNISNYENNIIFIPVGPSGAGKSSFAHKSGLLQTEIVSTDNIRAMLTNNELNQTCNSVVFELFHRIINIRMQYGHVIYADATNLKKRSRETLLQIADHYHYRKILLIFNINEQECLKNNECRLIPRQKEVILKHCGQMKTFLQDQFKEEFKNYDEIYQTNNVCDPLLRFERIDITA